MTLGHSVPDNNTCDVISNGISVSRTRVVPNKNLEYVMKLSSSVKCRLFQTLDVVLGYMFFGIPTMNLSAERCYLYKFEYSRCIVLIADNRSSDITSKSCFF